MSQQISDLRTLTVGETEQLVVPITGDGTITISAVTASLMAGDSTTDELSTYSSGTASVTGDNEVTGPLVGKNGSTTLTPGRWTLFLDVTYNGGQVVTLFQNYDVVEKKGNSS